MTPALRGHAAMLLFSVLVAGSFSLGSLAANEISPAALNAVRFAIAGVVIGVAALVTTGLPRRALVAPWRYLLLGGIFAAYFVLMFEGLKTAPPVSAAAVFTLTPVLAAGAGYILLRQVLTTRMALALALGAVGALWVIFRADVQALLGFEVGRGEAVYFVGCAAHAIYTPLVRKLNRGEAPVVFSFFTLLGGLGLLTIWGWSDLWATDWAALPAIVWVTILYVSVAASAMTFVLLQYAALRLPSSKVMAYTYLVPSWVILWELALGGTAPPALVLAGVALTVLALGMLLKD
ncbi:EamA-like transporter family protein [Litoreibacter ascidiaceicola]|uniref:EamA-like transporter family protein n=1 Tax=Litoreibacter ascidiaceicola TaxID=1486859 RepID=A0A1M4XVN6_9RHOB|nr:DMT family transporter [Litoreibacter ascidiaceicola]SHE97322.1 EamA-like transporter family protein [Litoreibacter ascidiaceicola]